MRTFQSRFGIGDSVLVGNARGIVVSVRFTASAVRYTVEFDDYIQEVASVDVNPA